MTSIKKGETKRDVVPSGSRCMETVIPTPLLHVMIKVVGWNWVIKASQLIHTPLLENCNAHTTFHFPVYFVTDVYLKQAKLQVIDTYISRAILLEEIRRTDLSTLCCASRNSFYCKTRSIYEVDILIREIIVFEIYLFFFLGGAKDEENINLILPLQMDSFDSRVQSVKVCVYKVKILIIN